MERKGGKEGVKQRKEINSSASAFRGEGMKYRRMWEVSLMMYYGDLIAHKRNGSLSPSTCGL